MRLYVNSAATSFNEFTKYPARISLQGLNDPKQFEHVDPALLASPHLLIFTVFKIVAIDPLDFDRPLIPNPDPVSNH
jgi:hypothetical protein